MTYYNIDKLQKRIIQPCKPEIEGPSRALNQARLLGAAAATTQRLAWTTYNARDNITERINRCADAAAAAQSRHCCLLLAVSFCERQLGG